MQIATRPEDESLRAMHAARDASGIAAALDAEPRNDILSRPLHAFYLADAWSRLGRRSDALQLLIDAGAAFDVRGNDILSRRRLNLLGAIYFSTGFVQEAEVAWRNLLAAASDAGDEEHVARANHNLGVIYTLNVRDEEAIPSFERAMGAYRTLGNRRGLAQCHHNLGIMYRELRFTPKADNHFLQAIRYAIADSSEDEVARAEQERALLIYAQRHDPPLAMLTARRALDRFTALRDAPGVGEALRVIGLIELGEGEDRASRGHLRDALAHAQASANRLLEAETMEAIGVLEDRAGDGEAAREMRNGAASIFAEIGAVEWGRRERERLSRAPFLSGKAQ